MAGKAAPSREQVTNDHGLSKWAPTVQAVYSEVGWAWSSADGAIDYAEFERILKEFEDQDKTSFAFRYPVDKKGAGSLPHHFAFDLKKFAAQIEPLLDVLYGSAVGLEEVLEHRLREAYEAQTYEGC